MSRPARHLRYWLAGFMGYFALLFAISVRETLALIAGGYTIVPQLPDDVWQKAEAAAEIVTGQKLSNDNPVREAVGAFEHLAGIEAGYGFFAPNVPDSYKLVFELQYADGSLDYDLIGTDNPETTLRVASLLDQLGGTDSEVFRAITLKLLAHSVWQRHPTATTVRAVVGRLQLPGPAEFRAGQRPAYVFLYAYQFTRSDEAH